MIKMIPFINNSSVRGNASTFASESALCLENSLPVKIVEIFVLSVILLSSLVGNVLVVTVVYKREELRETINFFIVNMAISDFVFPLTVIPETLAATANGSWRWPIAGIEGAIFCKLKNFLQRVSLAVSVGSLIWIAIDRFVAVALPIKVHLISSKFRAFAIASTWILAMVANCLDLYTSDLVEYGENIFCQEKLNTALYLHTYQIVRTVVIQIVPLVAMTMLYGVIAVVLRRKNKAFQSRAVHQKSGKKQRAINMAICIMLSFYISTFPLLVAFILVEYNLAPVPCPVWFIVYASYYLSSAVNPIICLTLVQSYRRGLKSSFTCFRTVKRLPVTTYKMETSEQGEITLQEIRILGMEENLAFSRET